MDRNYTVYMHKFPNEKVYIGLTRQNPKARWGLNGNGYKKQKIYEYILKYGWDNIEHIIIEENLTFQEAKNLEIELIKKYNSIKNGYNNHKGGGLGGKAFKTIFYNGSVYSSDDLVAMANVDITSHDVTTRLGHGWNVETILNTPKQNKYVKFEYKGEYYTAKELAEISPVDGLTAQNILIRINKHNWTVERAITQPKNKKTQPPGCRNKDNEFCVIYNGKEYKSYELLELSPVQGLTTAHLTCRINHHHWDIEKALNTPLKNRNVQIEYKGKIYSTKEIAEMSPYNITHHNVTDRLKKGWDVDKIIYTPLKKQQKK